MCRRELPVERRHYERGHEARTSQFRNRWDWPRHSATSSLSNLRAKQPAKNIRRPRLAHIQISLLGTLLGGKLYLAQRRRPRIPSRLYSKRDHTRNIPKLHACRKAFGPKKGRAPLVTELAIQKVGGSRSASRAVNTSTTGRRPGQCSAPNSHRVEYDPIPVANRPRWLHGPGLTAPQLASRVACPRPTVEPAMAALQPLATPPLVASGRPAGSAAGGRSLFDGVR